VIVTRSIISASLTRPVWQWGPHRVEGPDEDAFTLAVEALTQLGAQLRTEGSRGLQRLHLVGSFAPEADWAFGEALGLPQLEVRQHPSGSSGLWGALAAAAHDQGPAGREAVVAVDVASIVTDPKGFLAVGHGAGAAAFLLGTETGLAVLRHGFRGQAPGRSPSMKTSISGWLDALGLPPSGENGEVVFEAEDDAARWQAAWEEAAPGVTVTVVDGPPAQAGPAPALRAAGRLWELGRRLRTGGVGLAGEATRGRTGFAGFRMDGPVRWVGAWGAVAPGVDPANPRFLERESRTGTVSQGAYVPHPRYLENLASRWRLVGERCSHCRSLTFPIAGRCRSCGRSDGLQLEGLPRSGLEVEAITTISPGAQPTEFDALVEAAGGYDVAVVSLTSGVRATLQVTDTVAQRVRVGDRVSVALRRLYPMEGEWRYGLKAVPEAGHPVEQGPEAGPTSVLSRRRASSGAPTARRATPRARGGRGASRRRPA
jgi:uncharacterized OB-fold protein